MLPEAPSLSSVPFSSSSSSLSFGRLVAALLLLPLPRGERRQGLPREQLEADERREERRRGGRGVGRPEARRLPALPVSETPCDGAERGEGLVGIGEGGGGDAEELGTLAGEAVEEAGGGGRCVVVADAAASSFAAVFLFLFVRRLVPQGGLRRPGRLGARPGPQQRGLDRRRRGTLRSGTTPLRERPLGLCRRRLGDPFDLIVPSRSSFSRSSPSRAKERPQRRGDPGGGGLELRLIPLQRPLLGARGGRGPERTQVLLQLLDKRRLGAQRRAEVRDEQTNPLEVAVFLGSGLEGPRGL